ncbi:uncharacterized protein LOC132335917 [Haemorhous mexicanus]|uniref:uncharacterized protein LOC132335917 n=1 Tax=Haemorhous mexicanus TaxID=30427 RepID=UPI0028BDCB8E|nr:uncharacterized protein LOC132335917 [Haemorhous mexicanus]
MFIANIWKTMSSQLLPQQSIPAARAPVLQPGPRQTLCPVSCLRKDESTGVRPVLLEYTLALWDGPCPMGVHALPAWPMMAIPLFSGTQGGEWSLAAFLRWKVIPDCVGATPAQCRGLETIHICHGSHDGGAHGRGTAPFLRRPPSLPHGLTAGQGWAGGVAGGRTDRPWACPALPPTHLASGFAAFPKQPRGLDGHDRDSRPGALAAERPVQAARRLFGGNSEEVLSFSKTCLSCFLPPLALLAWPDCSGQSSPVFVPRMIPGVFVCPPRLSCLHSSGKVCWTRPGCQRERSTAPAMPVPATGPAGVGMEGTGTDLVTLLRFCLIPGQQSRGCTTLHEMVKLIHLCIPSDFCQKEVVMKTPPLGAWL